MSWYRRITISLNYWSPPIASHASYQYGVAYHGHFGAGTSLAGPVVLFSRQTWAPTAAPASTMLATNRRRESSDYVDVNQIVALPASVNQHPAVAADQLQSVRRKHGNDCGSGD